MKRYIAWLLVIVLLLSGCAAGTDGEPLKGVGPQSEATTDNNTAKGGR